MQFSLDFAMGDFSEDEDLELMLTQVTDKELLDTALCESDEDVSVQKLLEMPDMGLKTVGDMIEIIPTQDWQKEHDNHGASVSSAVDPLCAKLDKESSFIRLLDDM